MDPCPRTDNRLPLRVPPWRRISQKKNISRRQHNTLAASRRCLVANAIFSLTPTSLNITQSSWTHLPGVGLQPPCVSDGCWNVTASHVQQDNASVLLRLSGDLLMQVHMQLCPCRLHAPQARSSPLPPGGNSAIIISSVSPSLHVELTPWTCFSGAIVLIRVSLLW